MCRPCSCRYRALLARLDYARMETAPLYDREGGALTSTARPRLRTTTRCCPDIRQLCRDTALVHGVEPRPRSRSVPVYQGGAEYSLIRQSKETLAQQRFVLEQTRDQTRANVVTAWGQLVAGKAQVQSAQSQVTASEIALNGVREEAKAGQRTTLDVLNAQQALVNARVALVTAQHDRVV